MTRRVNGSTRARRSTLRLENLEPRCMLSDMPLGWLFAVVSDSDGQLFCGSLHNEEPEVHYLGDTGVPLEGVAFGGFDEIADAPFLYGIGPDGDGTSGATNLYQIELDPENFGGSLNVTNLGTIQDGEDQTDVVLTGLDIDDEGCLFAVGSDATGQSSLYQLDTEGIEANQLGELGAHEPAGGIAMDSEGRVLVTTTAGDLLRLTDPSLPIEVVGNLGVNDLNAMKSQPAPMTFAFSAGADVYDIDPETAVAELVASATHPDLDEATGLAIVHQEPDVLLGGDVVYEETEVIEPVLGEMWFEVRAANDAIFSVAVTSETGQDAQMTLYGEHHFDEEFAPPVELKSFAPEELTSGVGRVDYAAHDGQTFWLRIQSEDPFELVLANVVSREQGLAFVHGTDGQDTYEFQAGLPFIPEVNEAAPHELTFNKISYQFDAAETAMIVYHGNGGGDEVTFRPSSGFDQAKLMPETSVATGPGYVAVAMEASSVTFDGTGVDGQVQATLVGCPSDDRFEAWAEGFRTELTGRFRETLATVGVSNVVAIGGGGDDEAIFHDAGGADEFVAAPGSAWMGERIGQSSYMFNALNFASVRAEASRGGTNLARLYGSDGNDTFHGQPELGRLSGEGYEFCAEGFARTVAYAGDGGEDVATVYGSEGRDVFIGHADRARLLGAGFDLQPHGFGHVRAVATPFVSLEKSAVDMLRPALPPLPNGNDLAVFHDSPGNDLFDANCASASLSGEGFANEAEGFRTAIAFSSEGRDEALLADSPLDDVLEANPEGCQISTSDYLIQARGFSYSKSTSEHGGVDVAHLVDSPGEDLFSAGPEVSTLQSRDLKHARSLGQDFKHRAFGFARVEASSTAGATDTAYLVGSAADDLYMGAPEFSDLSGPGYEYRAASFEFVTAIGKGGVDTAHLRDSVGNDEFESSPNRGRLFGTGFHNLVRDFDYIHGWSTAGGTDVARMVGSDLADTFQAEPGVGKLWGATHFERARAFEEVYADAGEGDDTADIAGSIAGDLLEAESGWAQLSGPGGSFLHRVAAFESVTARAVPAGAVQPSGAGDRKDVETIDFALTLEGVWDDV